MTIGVYLMGPNRPIFVAGIAFKRVNQAFMINFYKQKIRIKSIINCFQLIVFLMGEFHR